MRKFDFPLAPLVLAFVIGPIMETALRQSLIMGQGRLHDLPDSVDFGDLLW